jgi:hypothetical protein
LVLGFDRVLAGAFVGSAVTAGRWSTDRATAVGAGVGSA